jgi:hypothetical protein
MRSTLRQLAGLAIATAVTAGPGFGQGSLGLTPDFPVGTSALTVTPQAGPWMICAASFSGQPSRGQAEDLATEIRTHYQLPACVFNRTAEERRAEQERIARVRAEKREIYKQNGIPEETPVYVKTVHIEDQYAVLIGGYKDDAIARKELEKIRKLKPSEKFAVYAYVPDPKTGQLREQAVNPFQTAFVCHNPTVPVEKPKQDADLSERLKEYNAHESYSLLKCSKPYTLVIKAYKGAATLESQTASASTMAKWGMGRKAADVMTGNEKAAHMAAEFLRNKQPGLGFEAYVLHTEYNSYVTIGGFDSADDPRLIQTMQYFLKELNRPGSGVNQLHMQAHFLTDPMPMPVPQVK